MANKKMWERAADIVRSLNGVGMSPYLSGKQREENLDSGIGGIIEKSLRAKSRPDPDPKAIVDEVSREVESHPPKHIFLKWFTENLTDLYGKSSADIIVQLSRDHYVVTGTDKSGKDITMTVEPLGSYRAYRLNLNGFEGDLDTDGWKTLLRWCRDSNKITACLEMYSEPVQNLIDKVLRLQSDSITPAIQHDAYVLIVGTIPHVVKFYQDNCVFIDNTPVVLSEDDYNIFKVYMMCLTLYKRKKCVGLLESYRESFTQPGYIKFRPLVEKKLQQQTQSNFTSTPDEEEIDIEGHRLTYTLSNNLDDIESAIYARTNRTIDLNCLPWPPNLHLSESVKAVMNRRNVNYSMTVSTSKGRRYFIVNKRENGRWFFISCYY
jgi:hypothetical protein